MGWDTGRESEKLHRALLPRSENLVTEDDTETGDYHPVSYTPSRAGCTTAVPYTKEEASKCTWGEEGCPGEQRRRWIKKDEHWPRDQKVWRLRMYQAQRCILYKGQQRALCG